jgi:hypothetical protein
LKKANVKIVQADPKFVTEVHKRSQPIIDDWVKKASDKYKFDARKVLDEFRAEIKKISAERK